MTYDIKNIAQDGKTFSSPSSIYFEMTGDNTCPYPSLHVQIDYETAEKPVLLMKKVRDDEFTPLAKFLRKNHNLDYDLIEAQLASFLDAQPFGIELHDRDVFYTPEYASLFSAPLVQRKFGPRDLYPVDKTLLKKFLKSGYNKNKINEKLFMSDGFLRKAFKEADKAVRNQRIQTLREKLITAFPTKHAPNNKIYLDLINTIFFKHWHATGNNFAELVKYDDFRNILVQISILMEANAERQALDDVTKTSIFTELLQRIRDAADNGDNSVLEGKLFQEIAQVQHHGLTDYFAPDVVKILNKI